MALNTLPRLGRGGRPILGRNKDGQPAPIDRFPQPCIKHETHSAPLTAIQRFEAALWAERNKWSIEQHKRGLAGDRKLSKGEAGKVLARELAALGGDV